MPTAQLVHRAEFCAAYRLENTKFDKQWNDATFGICHSPNFHGHNFEIEVVVGGAIDADTGMVMNLLTLMDIVRHQVIERFDHKNLNLDVESLQGVIPTTENIALLCWRLIEQELPNAVSLDEIRLRESRDNQVILKK